MDLDSASLQDLGAKILELRQQIADLNRVSSQTTSNFSPTRSDAVQLTPTGSGGYDLEAVDRSTSVLDDTEELARKYRITGRSCFPVELARGARAKEEIQEIDRERKRRKGKERAEEDEGGQDEEMVRRGVAVRLETYYNDRYLEPYYVVFAHRLPDLDGPATPSDRQLYIPHHTIPHWIPFSQLAWRYLGVRVQSDDANPAELAGDAKGGEPDLELFLSNLEIYLDAYVSRREQLAALRAAFSPAEPSLSSTALNFRLFSSEACDRVMVEWIVPRKRQPVKGGEDDDEREDEDEADVEQSIMVQVAFHDLRIERFEEIGEKDGASLLVRYGERLLDDMTPDHVFARRLAKEALGGPEEKRTMEQVVRFLVEETTADGRNPAAWW
ncbi:hypothetical protein JCM6882_009576 [Rhodosporidiobolus microsporus]